MEISKNDEINIWGGPHSENELRPEQIHLNLLRTLGFPRFLSKMEIKNQIFFSFLVWSPFAIIGPIQVSFYINITYSKMHTKKLDLAMFFSA